MTEKELALARFCDPLSARLLDEIDASRREVREVREVMAKPLIELGEALTSFRDGLTVTANETERAMLRATSQPASNELRTQIAASHQDALDALDEILRLTQEIQGALWASTEPRDDGDPEYRAVVKNARDHLAVQATVRTSPPGLALALDNAGRWCVFSADAWDRPAVPGLMPWSAPDARAHQWLRPDGVLVPWAERGSADIATPEAQQAATRRMLIDDYEAEQTKRSSCWRRGTPPPFPCGSCPDCRGRP
ncbi:MAG TPA: hypothetical protein VFO62_00445 [Candidatus Binatia bacterium]|nr:hypothetical protein [Candidatus Binatia bacterium]